MLVKGVPLLIGTERGTNPTRCKQRQPLAERPAFQRRPAAAPRERYGVVHRLAEGEARAPVGIPDTHQQHAPRGERGTHAREDAFLRCVVVVVQHIEDHDRIGGTVVYVTDIPVHDLHPREGVERERAPRTPHLLRIDLDAHVGGEIRRCRPAARPGPGALACVTTARREQPRREQSLACAQIEQPLAPARAGPARGWPERPDRP